MATVSLSEFQSDDVATAKPREWVRPQFWNALVVMLLVALHAAFAVGALRWLETAVEPASSWVMTIKVVMYPVLLTQTILLALWLGVSPLPVWFRLPLVFAIAYSLGVGVFEGQGALTAIAMVVLAGVAFEAIRFLTQWRIDYRPEPCDGVFPPWPRRWSARELVDSLIAAIAFALIGYGITGKGTGTIQVEAWSGLAIYVALGMAVSVPTLLIVFARRSKWTWHALGAVNVLAAALLAWVGFAAGNTLTFVIYAAMIALPQLFSFATFWILHRMGWRLVSVAAFPNPVAAVDGANSTAEQPMRSHAWPAFVMACLVALLGVVPIATFQVIVSMDTSKITNEWPLHILVQLALTTIVAGIVLLGLWLAWTPMPLWLRFPVVLGIAFACNACMTEMDGPLIGCMGALSVAIMMEPLRMITRWRCDYRPEMPLDVGLPAVSVRLSLREIFESIVTWSVFFGIIRAISAFDPSEMGVAGWVQIGLMASTLLVLALPACLLVYARRATGLWIWFGAVVSLVVVGSIAIGWANPQSGLAIAVYSLYWFGTAGVCAGTMYLLKRLGWRFYSVAAT